MNDTQATLRLWFLDWFGGMLDHDPVGDRLVGRPFGATMEPGLTVRVPLRFEQRCRPILEKRVSMPRSFPDLEMIERPENQVCFFLPARGTYLKSVPSAPIRPMSYYEATTPLGWETFLPLTQDMLRGLRRLFTPEALTLRDDSGNPLPKPVLDHGFKLRFEDRIVPLYRSLAALNLIGRSRADEADALSFVTEDERPFDCTVQHTLAPTP